MRFSESLMTMDLRSVPIRTLSLANSKSAMETFSLSSRAARSTASLTRFSMSAPEKPGVPRARMAKSTSSPMGVLRVCTCRIISRPLMSGRGTTTCRSNRPGRSRAGSRTSGRFVAETRMTPSLDSNPSISTRSWLSVCSRSSWPPPRPAPRWRPTASISSMKMMQGACFFPWSKRSRTREAPTPTNISTKSEPLMLRKGTSASPAMALASRVFPVPGEPTRSRPLGIRPPRRVNFLGSFRKEITSVSSSFASSMPATSAKVTFFVLSVTRRARLLPKAMAFPPPLCIWRMKKIHTPMSRIMGNQEIRIVMYQGESSTGLAAIWIPFAWSRGIRLSSFGANVLKVVLPSLYLPVMLSPWTVTSETLPASTWAMKRL